MSTERRAQVASPVPEGTGAHRGASAGQFGSRLRLPGAGKRDGGRERRKEGRRKECPGGRGLVGALGAGDRDGGGRARDAETRRQTALSPSTGGGRRVQEARGPAGPGLGMRPPGRGREWEERSPSSLACFLVCPRPCAQHQDGAGRLRRSPLVLAVVPGSGGGRTTGGDRGATPLFPTFFRSFWGLGGVCADLEPARRWGSGGEIAGHSEDSDHTSREGPPSSEWPGDCICRWYEEVKTQT